MNRICLSFLLTAALGLSGAVHAAPAAKMHNGRLVNEANMTLYTFDMDVQGSGKSKCNGPCATLWPPAMAAADARPEGDLSVITRDDGSRQWAYKERPLYTYSGDKQENDTAGDNVKTVWHIIK